MDVPLSIAPASVVRAEMARAVLGPSAAPPHLGEIVLYPHQRSAVDRLRHLLTEMGGALLADDPGLGKTYVALALAREANAPLIVAPAALRAMWLDRARRAGVRAEVATYSALSRGPAPAGDYDLLVLDEAHHARTPSTRRYARLALLAARARVLLLSATPIHNSHRDLRALLALFLGARAWSLEDSALLRCVVRRRHEDLARKGGTQGRVAAPDTSAGHVDTRQENCAHSHPLAHALPHLPALGERTWLRAGDDPLDAKILERIAALPAPVPPSDGGEAGALVSLSLLRQWASSDAALRGAIARRLARAIALEAALEGGRHLARAELSCWVLDGHTVQLGFPELLTAVEQVPGAPLLCAVRAHAGGLRELSALLGRSTADARRAALLRDLRSRHPRERIVAFASYSDTAHAFYRLLHADGQICALTARGGTVAGGPISRREALERFAPRAHRAQPPGPAERIAVLFTTDMTSEGVDLQDASVVVHLDLPWTAARMEQRVGRSRRMGAEHERTAVYLLAPPLGAERMLGAERRLRAKLAAAARTTGAPPVLPRARGTRGRTGDAEALRCLLAEWPMAEWPTAEWPTAEWLREPSGGGVAQGARGAVTAAPPPGLAPACRVAAIRAPVRSEIALVLALCAGSARLLAGPIDGPLDDAPRVVRAALEHAPVRCAECAVSPAAAERAARAAHRWCLARAGAAVAGVRDSVAEIGAPERRVALRRIARITARTQPHRRGDIARLATAARQAATAPFGVGAERVLGQLVAAPMDDEAWLRAMGAFGEAHGHNVRRADAGGCSDVADGEPTGPAGAMPSARESFAAGAGPLDAAWRPAALLLLQPE